MSEKVNGNGLVARHDGVYEVSGRMTFQTVPEFMASSNARGNGWGKNHDATITIDLSKVTLVDSAGVALMLEWMGRARAQQREIKFINLPEQLRHLIGVSGLDAAFGLS